MGLRGDLGEKGFRGCILADDMGLGKTLQTCVASTHRKPRIESLRCFTCCS